MQVCLSVHVSFEGLVAMVIFWYQRVLGVTIKSGIFSLSLSLPVPVSLSSSLLLLLEVTKEISSLDTIQGCDVNGKPFRQVNIEGKKNSGHEIK